MRLLVNSYTVQINSAGREEPSTSPKYCLASLAFSGGSNIPLIPIGGVFHVFVP